MEKIKVETSSGTYFFPREIIKDIEEELKVKKGENYNEEYFVNKIILLFKNKYNLNLSKDHILVEDKYDCLRAYINYSFLEENFNLEDPEKYYGRPW